MENNDPPPSPVTIPWLLPDGFRDNNHGFRNGPVRIFWIWRSCVLDFSLGTLVVGRGARFDGVFWAVACNVSMFHPQSLPFAPFRFGLLRAGLCPSSAEPWIFGLWLKPHG